MNQNFEQPYQYSTLNDYPPNYPPAPPKTNGKSIASLVLGILGIVIPYGGFLFGILAIIFSSLSLKTIKRTNEQGKGLAIAGLVCGIVGTVLWGIIILLVVLFLVAFSSYDSYSPYTNF